MSKQNDKVREVWIADLENWPHSETFLYDPKLIGHSEATKFIEYNAYLKLQEELDEARRVLSEIITDINVATEYSIYKPLTVEPVFFARKRAREFLTKYPKKEG